MVWCFGIWVGALMRIVMFGFMVLRIEVAGVCRDVIDWRSFSSKYLEASRFEAKREEVFLGCMSGIFSIF